MALCKFSERHFTLKRLNCGCCGLTNESAISLAEIVRQNCGLEAVELGMPSGFIFSRGRRDAMKSAYINQIGDYGIAYLVKSLY